MNYAVMAAALSATAVLLGFAGNRFSFLGKSSQIKYNDNAEQILRKTGTRFANEEGKMLLKKKITQANLDIEPEYFIGLQLALPAISTTTLIPFVLLGLIDIYWPVLLGLALYLGPKAWLNAKANERVAQMESELPSFCYTLYAVLDAGSEFYMAIGKICGHLKDNELAKEFQRALDAIAVGKRPTDAMFELAGRCSMPNLTNLIRSLEQCDRYGREKAPVIKEHADRILQRRKNEVAKRAGELSTKLLLIIMPCIFVPLIGLILFPVVYNLFHSMG